MCLLECTEGLDAFVLSVQYDPYVRPPVGRQGPAQGGVVVQRRTPQDIFVFVVEPAVDDEEAFEGEQGRAPGTVGIHTGNGDAGDTSGGYEADVDEWVDGEREVCCWWVRGRQTCPTSKKGKITEE